MVKLKWLKVNKLRSVKPGTSLAFNPGYNVLLGQNGTGKTTLLKLVADLASCFIQNFAEAEFDLEYELASSSTTAVLHVRNEARALPSNTPLEALPRTARHSGVTVVDGKLSALEFSAEVRIRLAAAAIPELSLRFEASKMHTKSAEGAPSSRPLTINDPALFWVMVLSGIDYWLDISALRDATELRDALLEPFRGDRSLVRFDESLTYFEERVEGDGFRAFRDYNGTIQPGSGTIPDSFQPPFLEEIRKQWGASRYVLDNEKLPFLKEVALLFDLSTAEAALELQKAKSSESDQEKNLGDLKFFFTYPNGTQLTAGQLSYGQKRMLSFMYYLEQVQDFAVADELVNGLHHQWIRTCIEKLGQRQVFLTSQNPLLLDYLTFSSPEQVQSTFILCRRDKESGQIAWENMPLEAAEDFYSSYRVGFQQVGELLQSKGLW